MATPVYLRDLKEEVQQQFTKDFDVILHMAHMEEQDIIVGYYIDKPKVEK